MCRPCSSSAKNIEDLVEALEVRFLANRDDNLHFGLLTDFQDAAEETLPEDEALVLLARQRIEELNEKYGKRATRSSFSIARADGIPRTGSGWDTSASAVSFRT